MVMNTVKVAAIPGCVFPGMGLHFGSKKNILVHSSEEWGIGSLKTSIENANSR